MSEKKIKITISTKKDKDPVIEGHDNESPTFSPAEVSRIEPATIFWHKSSQCVTILILGKYYTICF